MIRLNANDVKPYVANDPGRVPPELTMKVLLSPVMQQGVGNLGLGMTIYPPYTKNVPHTHHSSHEVWFVVSGRGEMISGTDRLPLEPDTVIVAPPGVEHYITNPFA